jgi:hypothetical protein
MLSMTDPVENPAEAFICFHIIKQLFFADAGQNIYSPGIRILK